MVLPRMLSKHALLLLLIDVLCVVAGVMGHWFGDNLTMTDLTPCWTYQGFEVCCSSWLDNLQASSCLGSRPAFGTTTAPSLFCWAWLNKTDPNTGHATHLGTTLHFSCIEVPMCELGVGCVVQFHAGGNLNRFNSAQS